MQKQEPEARSYRVLVVEDEGLIAHDISKRLESLGHTVVGTASTAEEALEAAVDAELVLMDIRIDGERDGIAAAAEIRERYHIPVIFLTAHADRSTLERAKAAVPYGYMVKPLGPATLQASIEIAIYKHAIERDLEEREAWLRTTVASAGEAILAADKQGNVLLMNPAAEALTGTHPPAPPRENL
jgi:CheY-like chemotaxis protein